MAPSAPFRALCARKSEKPAIETPSARNPAIDPFPQEVRGLIISSAWTSKRARTGPYASLVVIVMSRIFLLPSIYFLDLLWNSTCTEMGLEGVPNKSCTLWLISFIFKGNSK